jgi:hypothetical protein
MQNQTLGQAQPIVHARQLAVQGNAIEQGSQESMSENRAQEPLGRNELHDLVGRQALPAGINEGIA